MSRTTARPVKRILDLTAAAVLLALVAPLMLVVACAAWLSMGRPILFRQVRAGLGGRPFTLFKFRTMCEPTAADGRPLTDSERITPLGRFLRRTSLDELPQLLNVLRGEMSLVGPRPLLMQYLPRYSPEQARRHKVLPGITGWAQIHGRNAIDWDEKLALDVWYVDHWTLALDLRILWGTLAAVFSTRQVDHAADMTMPEFLGSASPPSVACDRPF